LYAIRMSHLKKSLLS